MTHSGDYYRALVSGRSRGLGPGLQRGALRLASVPYGWGTRVRNWLYDRRWLASARIAVPVVSVGNLTLGGTGKTPCVEYVARFYRQHDLRVAILSRGYGANGGRNDEAMVLEENLPDVPHFQGPDRVALAQSAVEELDSEVLVLDDGLQHRRLGRDLDIVLIDATEPWGHGYLFPRGMLREAPVGLRRAGVVVVTHADQVSAAERGRIREASARLARGAPVAEAVHRPVDLVNSQRREAPLQLLRERSVAAFCGIGNPENFRRTLLDLGARMEALRTFPDHHPYTRSDVDDLHNWARQQAKDGVVVTTQKDLVKLRLDRLGGRELWAVRIRLQVETGKDALDQQLKVVSGEW